MDTLQTAEQYIRHNQTPYWWVTSGSAKLAESVDTENIEDSIARFRESSVFWPDGNYRLECSQKKADRSGSFKLPFTKKGQSAATAQAMGSAQAVSTNAYNIPDHIYKQVVEEARFKMLVEGMADDFKTFMREWPEYKKKIDKIDAFLKDEDENGTPDIFENVKKGTEMVKTVSELGSVFKNVGKISL